MKSKVISVTLFWLMPLSAAAQTPDYIVEKVIAARGGLDKIRAVQAERVSGHISFGAEAEGPFVVEFKRPRKMHMEFTLQGNTMVRVYDGKSAGWANNPFLGKNTPEPMPEEDLRNIAEESDFDGPLVDYKAKGNQIELTGKDKVEGKEAYRLKLTTKSGDVRFYLLDSETFLLLKWESKRKVNDQELPVETYFRDYHDVGGLQYAFEIDSGASAEEITQKILIDKIELDPEINESRFLKPPAPPVAVPPAPPAPASSAPDPPETPPAGPPAASPAAPETPSATPPPTSASPASSAVPTFCDEIPHKLIPASWQTPKFPKFVSFSWDGTTAPSPSPPESGPVPDSHRGRAYCLLQPQETLHTMI
jgi:outer membrane lipoprotein-sorting protein